MKNDIVREYLRRRGFEDRILEFEESTATVPEAAAVLGCEPGRIAKTLAFSAGDSAVLVVAAGDARIDNRKFRDALNMKPRMLNAQDARRITGFAPGGVCPFAPADGVRVFLDESLRRFDTVFPACGSPSSAARFTPDELAACLEDAQWIDVCRIPEADN